MRFNCAHTFFLEAENREDFDVKLRRYDKLVRDASARLDIGYEHGVMHGQPQAGLAAGDRSEEPDEETLPEALFDA